MYNSRKLWRALFFLIFLAALCGSFVFPVTYIPVSAAPQMDAASHIVISQVYGGGGNSGATFTHDFIELFNRAATAVDLTGWSVQYASSTGTTWQVAPLTNVSIPAGQYYLVQLAGGANGVALPAPDATGSIAMSATAGKVALMNTTTALSGSGCPFVVGIIDFIGYGSGTDCSEGTVAPAPSATIADLRSVNGCNDTNNNSADFATGAPNPRNSASPANPCMPITVTDVTSSVLNNTYTTGNLIDITITFSGNVTIAGSPTLLLETGAIDRTATYASGSGSSVLAFSYTVMAGDSSADLDYVATDSLSGIIIGATGEAILTLPSPGSSGSLGANKNIVIDTPPSVISFSRQTPVSAITNADVLTFRVTFSEAVTGVDVGDFSATGTTGTLTLNSVSASVYDVIISGGNLPNLNGTVGLNLNPGHNIVDLGSNPLSNTVPSINETYTLDNTAPSILSFTRQSPSSATTSDDTLIFRATFSEAVTGVDSSDFVVTGTTGTAVVTSVSTSVYDVTISGGDLPNLNGTVGLNLAASPPQNITDLALNPLPAGEPPVDETYTVNNTVASSTKVVISEFRTAGSDEFIELYNPTNNWVDISGWKINGSNNVGTEQTRATIPAATILRPGQYYLLATRSPFTIVGTSTITANLTYGTGITDDGGIALLDSFNQIVDEVGMDLGSAYWETTPLDPLTDATRSYERLDGDPLGSCVDTNVNENDFDDISPPSPHNASTRVLCGGTSGPTLISTTTVITADSPDPSLVNGNVSVSVRVTGSSLSPSGTKVYITGANTNCTITLNSSGTGSCNVKFTSTGTKTITATFIGDNTHDRSTDTEAHTVSTSSTIRTPTVTRVPTLPPPPPLVAINEFVPRPGHDWNSDGEVNVLDEYIEIINHGTINVNLSGYSLDDEANIGSDPYRLPSVTIVPGERIVFYASETGLLLSDGGDGVRLLKANGQLADAYNYTVARYPDQSYCRLPDNGGLDDWNQNCFPTPGLQNSLSGDFTSPPSSIDRTLLCPIADTLPEDFVIAECAPYGNNIWRRAFWDETGWYGEKVLPNIRSRWDVFAD